MPHGVAQGMQADDVEAIERATFDAVPPEALALEGGWLLGIDHGTVGRAHSAVALTHAPAHGLLHAFPHALPLQQRHERSPDIADASVLDRIEARYAAAGLRAVFRVADGPAFEGVRAALLRRGYSMGKPTCTYTGTLAAMGMIASGPDAELLAQPDDAWRAVFLGEGFDPVDGASRVEILARARHAVFARLRIGGQTVAAGMGSYSHGWASVHGMRTLAPFRGRGLASQVLGALAREGQARGLSKVFLQVEASNSGAQALYRRAGFSWAWDYAYWTAPG